MIRIRAALVLVLALCWSAPSAAQINSPVDLGAFDTPAQRDAAILSGIAGIPSVYAGGCNRSTPCSFAALKAAAPCDATGGPANVSLYGIVNNYGTIDSLNTVEAFRCTFTTGFGYYWRPVGNNTLSATTGGTSGGTVTLSCVANAPVQFINGSISLGMTMNLQTADCWPGATFDVTNQATLGSLSIGGLVGGLTKTLGLTGSGRFVYTVAGWKAQ